MDSLGHIWATFFSILVENIEDILIIERFEYWHYLLKLREKPEMSIGWLFGFSLTHNPKIGGSNPSSATKSIMGLN